MGKWAGLPHGGPLSCSSTTPRRWKPPVALRELSWVACSSPWILEESWVVICASRHKTQTKPIILQSLAEVTDDERGFLLGGRGIGRGLGRGWRQLVSHLRPPRCFRLLGQGGGQGGSQAGGRERHWWVYFGFPSWSSSGETIYPLGS